MLRRVLLLLGFVVGCTHSTPPGGTAPTMTHPSTPASPAWSAHPLLGDTRRVRLLRYRPERTVDLDAPAAVEAFVTAIAPTQGVTGSVPRATPFAEVLYLDAQAAPVATVVFPDAEGEAVLSAGPRGSWRLSAAESSAVRALLAPHGM